MYEERLTERKRLLETFRIEEGENGAELASSFFGNTPFSNMQHYDVRDSMKRLTQFLYLFIKGRNRNKRLQYQPYVTLLCRIVKKRNF